MAESIKRIEKRSAKEFRLTPSEMRERGYSKRESESEEFIDLEAHERLREYEESNKGQMADAIKRGVFGESTIVDHTGRPFEAEGLDPADQAQSKILEPLIAELSNKDVADTLMSFLQKAASAEDARIKTLEEQDQLIKDIVNQQGKSQQQGDGRFKGGLDVESVQQKQLEVLEEILKALEGGGGGGAIIPGPGGNGGGPGLGTAVLAGGAGFLGWRKWGGAIKSKLGFGPKAPVGPGTGTAAKTGAVKTGVPRAGFATAAEAGKGAVQAKSGRWYPPTSTPGQAIVNNAKATPMSRWAKAGKALKWGGKALGPAASIGLGVTEGIQREALIDSAADAGVITGEEEAEQQRINVSEQTGGVAGAIAMGTVGATIGSAIPIVGTAIGGIIGGVIGYYGGKWAGGEAGEKLNEKFGVDVGDLEKTRDKVFQFINQIKQEDPELADAIQKDYEQIYPKMVADLEAEKKNSGMRGGIKGRRWKIDKDEEDAVNVAARIRAIQKNLSPGNNLIFQDTMSDLDPETWGAVTQYKSLEDQHGDQLTPTQMLKDFLKPVPLKDALAVSPNPSSAAVQNMTTVSNQTGGAAGSSVNNVTQIDASSTQTTDRIMPIQVPKVRELGPVMHWIRTRGLGGN